MEAYHDAMRRFRQELDDYRVRSHYDINNGKKESEGYMKELYRMQKLDHIRVQVSQKMNERSSIADNPNFNKTVDFNQLSYQKSIDNDSLTQDSLFISQENMNVCHERVVKIEKNFRHFQAIILLNFYRTGTYLYKYLVT